MTKIQKLRRESFNRQAGRCYYCLQPMWLRNPELFAKNHCIPLAKAKHLKASAEHLTARSDGGQDVELNIVAACVYCNRHRHMTRAVLPPSKYQRKVCDRLAVGRWHGLRLT